MKSIVVEEQEQEEGSESETGFVSDLDQDTLHNELKRLNEVTLMRAARVNKLWRKVAGPLRCWESKTVVLGPLVNGAAPPGFTPGRNNLAVLLAYERVNLPQVAKCRGRGLGLVESEEQDENKKMKSIVVEEQEQEEGSESETGFVFDLDQDTLHNVLKRLDEVTLMRAARVNKLWRKVAGPLRCWESKTVVIGPLVNGAAPPGLTPGRNNLAVLLAYERVNLPQVAKPPTLDFYSIDPQVFSSQIGPWVQNTEELTNNRG